MFQDRFKRKKSSIHLSRVFFSIFVFCSAECFCQDLDLPQGGVNLSSYRYWSTAFPFREIAKMGNGWISTDGNVWDDNRSMSLTGDGFPASLLPDQQARSLVFTHNSGIFPSGSYALQWDGNGRVELDGSGANLETSGENSATYAVESPANIGLLLYIRETDPNDPVTNIRMQLPDSNTWPTEFNPDYLRDLESYSVLRNIDWNATNSSTISSWSERTMTDHAHWGSSRGVPYEHQIELSNVTGKDLWLSIPHLADDEYVRELGQLVENQLNPELRVWVEYSNEVWNGIFSQHDYAEDELMPRYGVSSISEAYGLRSTEVFDIFRSQFEAPQRMLSVIAGQAANAWQLEQAIKGVTSDGVTNADVAAIAPYVTLSRQQMELLHREFREGTANKDQVFADLFDRIDVLSEHWVANKQVADEAGLPLITYEAGQHLAAVDNFQRNDNDFIDFLHDLNRDPRMGDLYLASADKWEQIGGETLIFYNDVAAWSQFGSWGLKESYVDDDSVKFAAVQKLLNRRPGDVNLDGTIDFADFLKLSADFGGPGVWSNGDFDGDDLVSFGDFLLLSANFNRPVVASHPVPEPHSILMLAIAVLILLLGTRNRERSANIRSCS